MLIRVPGPNEPRPSEITPHGVYLNRRAFMAGAAAAAAVTLAGCEATTEAALKPATKGQPLTATRNQGLSVADPPTPWESATTYNNFYEFGTDKADPRAERAHPQDAALDGRRRRALSEAARPSTSRRS